MARANITHSVLKVPARVAATLTRKYYPKSMEEVLEWSNEMWLHHGVYAQALAKAVSYFMTSLSIRTDLSEVAKAKGTKVTQLRRSYKDALENTFNVLQETTMFGIDYVNWGNVFAHVYMPFLRTLRCPRSNCGNTIRYDEECATPISVSNKGAFSGICPKCRSGVTFDCVDTRCDLRKHKPNLMKFDPALCVLEQSAFSGTDRVTVEMHKWPWAMEGVKERDPFFLGRIPQDMLKAMCSGQPYRFKPGKAIHMGLPQPATLSANFRGYGLPLFMHQFEDVLRILLVDKLNESVLVNHGAAIRCISPAPQVTHGTDFGQMSPGIDRNSSLNVGAFAGSVQAMLRQHQKNPSGYHMLPHPVVYSEFGGNARSMVMPDMMEHFERRLLRAMGIPVEFYDASLSTVGQLIGMRLFQQRWRFFMTGMNDFLTAVSRRVGAEMDWPEIDCQLAPPSMVFDPNTINLDMQLHSAGQLSTDALYERADRDGVYERQRLEEEEEYNSTHMERRQRVMQKQTANRQYMNGPSEAEQIQQNDQMMQQQQQQGGPGAPPPAAGGAPSGAPSDTGRPATITEMAERAQQTAQELAAKDENTKRRELARIKAVDRDMYFQVKGYLDSIRQNAELQGAQMVQQGQVPPQV
jgi:hypothetical protein